MEVLIQRFRDFVDRGFTADVAALFVLAEPLVRIADKMDLNSEEFLQRLHDIVQKSMQETLDAPEEQVKEPQMTFIKPNGIVDGQQKDKPRHDLKIIDNTIYLDGFRLKGVTHYSIDSPVKYLKQLKLTLALDSELLSYDRTNNVSRDLPKSK